MREHWEDKAIYFVMSAVIWPYILLEKLRLSFPARLIVFPVAMLFALLTAPITFLLVILVGLPCLMVAVTRDMDGGYL